jgi:hypothetical protein
MNNGMGLKIVAGVAVVLAIVAGAGTFTEYNTAKDLTAQLNAATAEVQGLREKLAAATADAQQAHTRAAVLDERVSAEQQLLAKEARPDLPIKMGFRPSLLGNGKVAIIENISNSEIEVTLDVVSPATGLAFHRALVIEANRSQQIGKNEGWEFAAGQQVKMSNPRYRPAGWTVGG